MNKNQGVMSGTAFSQSTLSVSLNHSFRTRVIVGQMNDKQFIDDNLIKLSFLWIYQKQQK